MVIDRGITHSLVPLQLSEARETCSLGSVFFSQRSSCCLATAVTCFMNAAASRFSGITQKPALLACAPSWHGLPIGCDCAILLVVTPRSSHHWDLV